MKNLTKLLAFLLALLCFACLPASAERGETTPYNWYFSKNDRHERPTLDSNLEFISDYDCVFLGENEKVIYLTFDAGYENGNVEKVLDALDAHNAKGAFFVLSNLVKRNPELLKRMESGGHLVCNHTAKHPDMSAITEKSLFKKQLADLEKVCAETVGCAPAKFYRPPEGRFSKQNLRYAQELGYKTVFWSYAYCDWNNQSQPDPEKAIREILEHTHNGMVILLHPTSATNAAIMDRLLTAWEKEGYRFGSLEELAQ